MNGSMISMEQGKVEKVLWSRGGIQCLEVTLAEQKAKAFNYPSLTGKASSGDRVLLNTTAVKLGLGSGGYHFVAANFEVKGMPLSAEGHIMKLRYTPLQLKVHAYEEILNKKDPFMASEKYRGLEKIPVVMGELHSMLAPFVLALKRLNPERKIVYIMTDSAALPLYLSNTVHRLKANQLLGGTVTCGHAFGGDLETVNIYTALMAAREELKADIIIVTPGPGVVGTSTRYGYGGVEQGENIDRIRKLKGIPVVIPRISFSDPRERHYGLSHHTLTALGEISTTSAFLPFPLLDKRKMSLLFRQLKNSGILLKHKIVVLKNKSKFTSLDRNNYDFNTMGRGMRDDPAFFAAAAAAASFTEKLLNR